MKTNLLVIVGALVAILPSCVPLPPMPMPLPMPPPPCMVQGGPPPGFNPGFQGNFYGPPKPIGINPETGVNYYGDVAASVVDPNRCWGPPVIRHFDEQQRTVRNWGQ